MHRKGLLLIIREIAVLLSFSKLCNISVSTDLPAGSIAAVKSIPEAGHGEVISSSEAKGGDDLDVSSVLLNEEGT